MIHQNTKLLLLLLLLLSMILYSGCQYLMGKKTSEIEHNDSIAFVPDTAVIGETFTTRRDTTHNVDSPAFWQGPDGQNWLLATAKETDVVMVYDAATGDSISMFGTSGAEAGKLKRPNGIAVIDNMALVVERDNHRIQVFSLPDFQPLGFFGEKKLQKPYGLAVDFFDNQYHIYVTDNYEMPDESTPPADSLGQRVHYFTLKVIHQELFPVHQKAFGDTSGDGMLLTVESILIDRPLNRLLIADEHEVQRNIKIYDLEGRYTGYTIPNDYFRYEPEGIALWVCSTDTSGYYITTDQDEAANLFQVFDRKSLEYRGSFSGEITRNTDGIALTQTSFEPFVNGAFFPVHDDGNIAAISWIDIAVGLGLRLNCN